MWDALNVQMIGENYQVSIGWSFAVYMALGTVMAGFRPLYPARSLGNSLFPGRAADCRDAVLGVHHAHRADRAGEVDLGSRASPGGSAERE